MLKFKVSRTSFINNGDIDQEPIEEALADTFVAIEEISDNAPLLLKNHWEKFGRNHRKERGKLKRDINKIGFFIELETLEDLINLVKKYGEISVKVEDGMLTLELTE